MAAKNLMFAAFASLLLAACSGSQDFKAQGNKNANVQKADATTNPSGDDSVVEPVEVSGFELTCALAPNEIAATNGESVVGCNLVSTSGDSSRLERSDMIYQWQASGIAGISQRQDRYNRPGYQFVGSIKQSDFTTGIISVLLTDAASQKQYGPFAYALNRLGTVYAALTCDPATGLCPVASKFYTGSIDWWTSVLHGSPLKGWCRNGVANSSLQGVAGILNGLGTAFIGSMASTSPISDVSAYRGTDSVGLRPGALQLSSTTNELEGCLLVSARDTRDGKGLTIVFDKYNTPSNKAFLQDYLSKLR